MTNEDRKSEELKSETVYFMFMIDTANMLVLTGTTFFAFTISGAAGFGGALLLLPVYTHFLGPQFAIPILTIVQLIGNFSRVTFGFKEIQWREVRWFLVAAIPMAILGACFFAAIPKGFLVRLIGVFIFFLVALRLVNILHVKPSKKSLLIGGGATGLLSGLIGSAGPLGAAIFLSFGFPAGAYIATEATTAVFMHMVKIVVYQNSLNISNQLWFVSLLLGSSAILGTKVSKMIADHIPAKKFSVIVSILLVVVAIKMMIWG